MTDFQMDNCKCPAAAGGFPVAAIRDSQSQGAGKGMLLAEDYLPLPFSPQRGGTFLGPWSSQ